MSGIRGMTPPRSSVARTAAFSRARRRVTPSSSVRVTSSLSSATPWESTKLIAEQSRTMQLTLVGRR